MYANQLISHGKKTTRWVDGREGRWVLWVRWLRHVRNRTAVSRTFRTTTNGTAASRTTSGSTVVVADVTRAAALWRWQLTTTHNFASAYMPVSWLFRSFI